MSTRQFRPALIPAIATLVVMAVCMRAGFWQLDRAAQRTALAEDARTRAEQGPRSLAALLALDEPANYPLQVRGEIDNLRPILLDNRMLDGRAGYHVLSPMRTHSGHHLLINRGWIHRGPDRNLLPNIPAIEGDITVHGQSYVYSDRTWVLAEDDLSEPQWPLRIQRVEMGAIGAALGVELAPFELRVTPDFPLEQDAEQLPRVWQDAIMTPDRHRAYAVQWFGLAMAVLVIFVAASFRSREPDNDNLNA